MWHCVQHVPLAGVVVNSAKLRSYDPCSYDHADVSFDMYEGLVDMFGIMTSTKITRIRHENGAS